MVKGVMEGVGEGGNGKFWQKEDRGDEKRRERDIGQRLKSEKERGGGIPPQQTGGKRQTGQMVVQKKGDGRRN